MGDFAVHALLFAVVTASIVLLGTFHAEAEDRAAFGVLPKRAFTFVLGCAVLAALVVLA